jgi:adhesin transport system outer membrane protein
VKPAGEHVVQAAEPIAAPDAAPAATESSAAFSAGASLEDTIRKAIATNPRIGIVAANREAIEEELRQARGLYLPQIDGNAGIGWERTNDSGTRSRLDPFTVVDEDAGSRAMRRQESSVTLVQRVFTGFETESEIARQKARIESAANRVYENAEVLGLDAIDAYLAVSRQRELVVVAEDNLKVHEETLQSIRAAAAGGAGSSADVSQAETRVARAKASLYQTQNDLRDAEALYINIVGEAPGDMSRPPVPASVIPAELEGALEMAAKNNPTIAIFGSDVKVAGAEIKLAEAQFYPQVNIEGEATYNDGRDAVETWERNSQIMLRTRWNLYRGGIDVANRREAVAREAEAKNRLYNAHIDAQQQMRRSWNALVASQDRVQALTEGTNFAQQTRDAYRQQFRIAQRTLLDVLDAENEFFVTRGQLISAEYNEILSSYRILAVAGSLLKTLGVEAPKSANTESPSFIQQMIR